VDIGANNTGKTTHVIVLQRCYTVTVRSGTYGPPLILTRFLAVYGRSRTKAHGRKDGCQTPA
jgi:hypothetical protein